MRHANSRCTLNVYSQASVSAKREVQQRVVQMMLPDEGLTSAIKLQRKGPWLPGLPCWRELASFLTVTDVAIFGLRDSQFFHGFSIKASLTGKVNLSAL
jgi:hypothetical protein